MKDKDYIKELFSEKLSGHEVPVRGDLWSGIQSQMASTATTAATKGISIAAKWAIGIASSVIVAGSVVWLASDKETSTNEKPQISHVQRIETEKETENVPSISPEVSNEKPTVSAAPNGQKGQSNMNASDAFGGGIMEDQEGKNPPLIVKERKEVSEDRREEKRPENVSAENPDKKEATNETNAASNDTRVVGKIEEWAKTNTFSPNNDGINDFFYLKTNNLKEFNISVINDKGQVVFTSPEADFKWDGMDRKTGEIVPAGHYVYMIIAMDKNGNPIKLYNNLTVSK